MSRSGPVGEQAAIPSAGNGPGPTGIGDDFAEAPAPAAVTPFEWTPDPDAAHAASGAAARPRSTFLLARTDCLPTSRESLIDCSVVHDDQPTASRRLFRCRTRNVPCARLRQHGRPLRQRVGTGWSLRRE